MKIPTRSAVLPWVAAIALVLVSSVRGDVRLPRLVGDNMVLQRDKSVSLWGWADPGERVRLDFQGAQGAATAGADGRWSISAGPFPAGGPYRLTIRARNVITLRDILVGDVWLASGQSNMEFPLRAQGGFKGVNNAEVEIAGANFPRIRLFQVRHRVAAKPAADVDSQGWTAATPETAGSFSAVAYLFGRELHQRYGVPIGLIESDWGATVAEAWVSADGLAGFPAFQPAIDALRSLDEKTAAADFGRYLQQRAEWIRRHGAEDRGRDGARNAWAEPGFDDGAWPTRIEPPAYGAYVDQALKGFDGAVWYRRTFDLPRELAGKDLLLHLSRMYLGDTTYFNGREIGHGRGFEKFRAYLAPGELVRPGRNVVAVRLTGMDSKVGMGGESPDKMYAEIGATRIPLAGRWSYQTGADLGGLPEPTEWAKINSDPNAASLLFNGMVSPLTPFQIKGVIWYQGESNAVDNRAAQYRTLFPALIRDWRSRWGRELPFLFVQLAGWEAAQAGCPRGSWEELREAQGMALSLPRTGMATAVDVGDPVDIHPRDKQDVAHRLALAAARVAYGENVMASGPTCRTVRSEGDRIRIDYSDVGSGLVIRGGGTELRGFEIAGADGRFVPAEGRREGPAVVVRTAAIPRPVAVRYDWSDLPEGNLYNLEGLPAVPFRADCPSR